MKLKHSPLIALCLCTYALSQDAIELGTIKVSTTNLGQEQSIRDVQASIEVIDKKDIKKLTSKSLPLILNEAIGLSVRDSGSTSSVRIRGFGSDHTLILVDGMRRTYQVGSSVLSSIQPEDIERIEIVRGPMSALYGSDALAGVINIITKKGTQKDYNKVTVLGAMAQNHEREGVDLRFNGAKTIHNITHNYGFEIKEKGDYRFDKNAIATNIKKESKQFASYGNTIRFNEDTLTSRLEFYNLNDKGTNYKNYDTFEQEKRYQLTTQYNHNQDTYAIDANFGYGYSDVEIDRGSGLEFTKYNQLEGNAYFRHYTTESMVNIFGVGYKDEKMDATNYKDKQRDSYSVLFQNEWEIVKDLSSSIGVRYDDYNDVGSATTPKISLKYILDDFNFRVSYGEAFKAPSFHNMYTNFIRSSGPVTYDTSGNPNLKPEESKTYEYALGYINSGFAFDVIHHRSKLDNLITSYNTSYNPITKTSYGSYKNIDKATINGTEVSLRYKYLNQFGIKTSWENLDTKDETTNERLVGSAKNSLKLGLSYEVSKIEFNLNVKRYIDYYGPEEGTRNNTNSRYTVADFRTDYDLSNSVELFFGIDNIQNKIAPYGMSSNDPGERYYYAGMSVDF